VTGVGAGWSASRNPGNGAVRTGASPKAAPARSSRLEWQPVTGAAAQRAPSRDSEVANACRLMGSRF